MKQLPIGLLAGSVVFVLIVACGPDYRVLSDRAHESPTSPLNILSLAAPPNTSLDNPWDAREIDVLNTAANRTPGSNLVMAAVVTTTTNCPNGGTTTQTTDNQPPPWFSQGDTYTTTYANCVRGTSQLNGAQSFTVDVMTGQPYVDTDWSSSTTIAWKDLTRSSVGGSDANTLNGNMTEKTTVTNTTAYVQEFSGASTRTWQSAGTLRTADESYQITYAWDDITRAFTWDFTVSSTNAVLGSETAESTQTLTGTLGQSPEAGQLKITKTDTAGVVTVTLITAIGGGQVRVETDTNNDGVVDKTETTFWNQLILNSNLYRFL